MMESARKADVFVQKSATMCFQVIRLAIQNGKIHQILDILQHLIQKDKTSRRLLHRDVLSTINQVPPQPHQNRSRLPPQLTQAISSIQTNQNNIRNQQEWLQAKCHQPAVPPNDRVVDHQWRQLENGRRQVVLPILGSQWSRIENHHVHWNQNERSCVTQYHSVHQLCFQYQGSTYQNSHICSYWFPQESRVYCGFYTNIGPSG